MAVNVVLKSVFDDKGIKAAQSEFAKVGKTVGVAFAAVGATLAVAGAAAARFGSDAIKAAEGVQQANNRLAQVNKSMSLFGNQTQAVTKRLIDFAEANELSVAVDAEVIKATQAKLLTFKNLAATADQVGGAMDRATMAALDLAAAGFGSAETNAVQLGKALQDPIKGITALARAGVTFTAQERENIKVLTESGQVLEAQNLILQAIETQVGGTAEATAKASDKMALAFENIKEEVGAALLPAFEDLSNDLVKIVPQFANALAPAAREVAQIIRQEVTPAVQRFGEWLKSPSGTKAIADFTRVLIDTIKGLFDLARAFVSNFQQIKTFTVLIGGAVIALKAMETAINLAKAAQLLFNVAVKANPYVLAATALIALAGGMTAVMVATKDSTSEFDSNKMSADKLIDELAKLKAAYEDGLIPTNKFIQKQAQLENQLRRLRNQGSETAGELNRLYNLGGMANAKAANDAWAKSWVARGKAAVQAVAGQTSSGSGVAGGMSAADQKKEFDKIAKDTQSSLRKARAAYNTSVANARKQYTKAVVGAESDFAGAIAQANAARDSGLEKAALDNTKRVAEIQRSFANQLTNIIQQSQDRLRDVYRTAVTTNIADLFGTEQVNKSVDALVGELRKKLEASRTLLANASKLAAAGFSQTFIEQVVAAGTTSGNELAQSILEATPETQAELKSLYGALESQSERGMDDLARTIYEGAGLATSELRKLYDQTVVDQTNALAEQAALYAETQAQILSDFDNAITEANAKRDAALAAAQQALKDALIAATKEYRDSLDEIEADFKSRIEALGKLQAELLKRQGIVAGQIGGAQANIPSIASQIGAVEKATVVTIPPSKAITGGNTVNVNVKVDPGTSAAQAGKKIASVVQKYTSAGGGGSAMPWQVL